MSRLVTAAAIQLLRDYLLEPRPFWSDAGDRQIRKLAGFWRRFRGDGRSDADACDELFALAQLRARHAPAPLYLANIGSSGSHWLEDMLARATGMVNCGEVYLPQPLLRAVNALTVGERSFFVHAVYAVHSGRGAMELLTGRFINSAHYARPGRLADLTPGSSRVLLVRHPVDVVMSRTLRKQEYRQEVAAEQSDAQYLESNCRVVESFYADACTQSFDARVRYEDLTDRPVQALADLLQALGVPLDADRVQAAAVATDAATARAAAARGETAPTNLYLGEQRAPDPALLHRARERLAGCCRLLGYEP